MKTIKTKNTIWYLADDYELLQVKIAISKIDLEYSILSKKGLIADRMPKQPPDTFWLEDTEYEEDNILYITRKWVKKKDMIWMESL